jgi:hypothetical protein
MKTEIYEAETYRPDLALIEIPVAWPVIHCLVNLSWHLLLDSRISCLQVLYIEESLEAPQRFINDITVSQRTAEKNPLY